MATTRSCLPLQMGLLVGQDRLQLVNPELGQRTGGDHHLATPAGQAVRRRLGVVEDQDAGRRIMVRQDCQTEALSSSSPGDADPCARDTPGDPARNHDHQAQSARGGEGAGRGGVLLPQQHGAGVQELGQVDGERHHRHGGAESSQQDGRYRGGTQRLPGRDPGTGEPFRPAGSPKQRGSDGGHRRRVGKERNRWRS
ncbi:MAG: hypothetical protein WKF73_09380 [Nocardioidaceae bacterium]